jgi:hypothetical protein
VPGLAISHAKRAVRRPCTHHEIPEQGLLPTVLLGLSKEVIVTRRGAANPKKSRPGVLARLLRRLDGTLELPHNAHRSGDQCIAAAVGIHLRSTLALAYASGLRGLHLCHRRPSGRPAQAELRPVDLSGVRVYRSPAARIADPVRPATPKAGVGWGDPPIRPALAASRAPKGRAPSDPVSSPQPRCSAEQALRPPVDKGLRGKFLGLRTGMRNQFAAVICEFPIPKRLDRASRFDAPTLRCPHSALAVQLGRASRSASGGRPRPRADHVHGLDYPGARRLRSQACGVWRR